VLFAWSVTTFARHAEHVTFSSIAIRDTRASHGLKERPVTFKTTRQHWPAEIQRPVTVTRTVDPAYGGPKGDWKLKELIVLAPVKICLAFASGTDDDVETLRDRNCVGRRSEHTGLKETVWARFEAIEEFGFGGLEDVVKLAEDGILRRIPRSEVMGGPKVICVILVTGQTLSVACDYRKNTPNTDHTDFTSQSQESTSEHLAPP